MRGAAAPGRYLPDRELLRREVLSVPPAEGGLADAADAGAKKRVRQRWQRKGIRLRRRWKKSFQRRLLESRTSEEPQAGQSMRESRTA